MKNEKQIHSKIDLLEIKNTTNIFAYNNTGVLEKDFYTYSNNFYDAANEVIKYLLIEAFPNRDVYKLDLWYFSMIYLYRQSLELLLKACIFKIVTDNRIRKDIISEIRHDLKQAFEKIIELNNLSTDENENAKWLMDFLSNIIEIDTGSDAFRYPINYKNQESIENFETSLIETYKNMNKAYKIIVEFYNIGIFSNKNYERTEPELIINSGHPYQKSINYKFSKKDFFPYCTSYIEVAIFLKNIIIKDKKEHLFMPTCYLYRNAIELDLKRLIMEDSHLSNDDALKIFSKKKHSILGLWNSIINEIEPYENKLTLNDIEKHIQALHDLDTYSDLFRYPCNKNMESYFCDSINFDIENISAYFEKLHNFLYDIDCMLSEIKQYELESNHYF